MNLLAQAIGAVERTPLPDALTLAGIDFLVGRTRRKLEGLPRPEARDFARAMSLHPIALHTVVANAQHYELPSAFFGLILGPRRKYSCCFYSDDATRLAAAEDLALRETIDHADLRNGQSILELGCGWGSLSLFMAEHFPASRIVAVSNSHSQRRFIESQATARGLANLSVLTADMNFFACKDRFDRIVSVEMFEHMSNWAALLKRTRDWLTDEGRMFLHVFNHRAHSYRFDPDDRTDWIARHFFTGGIMPGRSLPHDFPDLFSVEAEWRWSGRHYQRTALHWLANFDAHRPAIDAILHDVYGPDARLWRRRWRLFFLAVAGLFGHAGGEEWGVGHYRLAPNRQT